MQDNEKSRQVSVGSLDTALVSEMLVGGPSTVAGSVDFAFLAEQTFADAALQREVLELFVVQARTALTKLPDATAREQADIAHMLKGSARSIGAFPAADAAAIYEATDPPARHDVFPDLVQAFAAAEAAIAAHLAAMPF